jgi:asparagine synthase (glutamine-hydrolysing)
MCGIAGQTGRNPEQVKHNVACMSLAIARRGPDSHGEFHWPRTSFAHRRLAILDLSPTGHQPMLSADGLTGVVFNGCIYNWRELRAELEALGYNFVSRCDTEVLVHGYRAWGIDMLARRLRGMFAIGIWDETTQALHLLRDRMGVKPLCFALNPDGLAFASSVAALQATGLYRNISAEAVLAFLEYGYVPDHLCIYQGIEKLHAAEILTWQQGKIHRRYYWNLPGPEAAPGKMSFEDAVSETERIFVEAVRLRLDADVPVAALLSGGIDSALVCWGLREANANLRTYTISTEGDPSNEATQAAETARILGLHHELIPLPPHADLDFDDLHRAYSEPFAISSAFGMMRLSRVIKPSATVLLTGDGGDDIFLGYDFHKNFHLASRIANALPAPLARGLGSFAPALSQFESIRRPMRLIDYATGGLGAVIQAHIGLPVLEQAGALGPRLASLQLPERSTPRSLNSARHLVEDVLEYDRRHQFTGEFMTKVDAACADYAVEGRSPFLDHALWDFAARLPVGIRLQGGVLKAILRTIVSRRIGPSIASRPKLGFTVSVSSWLAGPLRHYLDELTPSSPIVSDGWTDWKGLEQLRRQGLAAGRIAEPLYRLVVLNQWLSARS